MTMLDRWHEVFGGHGGDYLFTMSNVSIGGEDVTACIENGEWVLTQRMSNGGVWTARSDDKVSAVLLLIAGRSGNARVNGSVDYDSPSTETP